MRINMANLLTGMSCIAAFILGSTHLEAKALDIPTQSSRRLFHYKAFEGYGKAQEDKNYAHLAIDFVLKPVEMPYDEELEELHPMRQSFSVDLKNTRMSLLTKPGGLFSKKEEIAVNPLAPEQTLLLHIDIEEGKVKGSWEKDSGFEKTQNQIQWNAKRAFSHFHLQDHLLISLKDPLENLKQTLVSCFSYLENDGSDHYLSDGEHFIRTEKSESQEKECCTVTAVKQDDAIDISYLKVLQEKGYWLPKRTIKESLLSE